MSGRVRALVLEDERPARNYLVELLHDTERVSVVAAVGSAEQATAALNEEPSLGVEAAFVDVRLAGSPHDQGGLEWMRQRAAGPSAPRFVLTTASADHALEGFRLGAIDYLLKPFTAERVAQCVDRLLGLREARGRAEPPPRVVAREGRSLVFLQLDEVLAFEAQTRLTFVHSARGRFDLDLSLSAVQSAFGEEALLRVHRNWLVHTGAVIGLDRDGDTELVLGRGGVTLRAPVARERAVEVRDRLIERAVGLRRV